MSFSGHLLFLLVLMQFATATWAQDLSSQSPFNHFQSGMNEAGLLKAVVAPGPTGEDALRLVVDTSAMSQYLIDHLHLSIDDSLIQIDPEQAVALLLNGIREMRGELLNAQTELKNLRDELTTMTRNMNTFLDMILSEEFGDRLRKK
jgi:hypothetical protein